MHNLLTKAGYQFSHESKYSKVYFKGGLVITINKATERFKCHLYGVRLDVSFADVMRMGNMVAYDIMQRKYIEIYNAKGVGGLIKHMCYEMSLGSDIVTHYSIETEERAKLIKQAEKLIETPNINFNWN